METIRVNLMPFERRQSRRCRVRQRRWVVVVTACTLGWAAAGAFVALRADEDRTLQQEYAATRLLVETAQTEVAGLRRALVAALVELRANNAVGRQPDWGLLLALLSETLRDQIVLRDLELRGPEPAPVSTNATGPTTPKAVAAMLKFSGLGLTQADVSQFILRLEQVRLFRSVKLIDTRREPFGSDHAVAFGIECIFVGVGEVDR